MKLTSVDPYALARWADVAYAHSEPGDRVEIHVTPNGWELRARGCLLILFPDRDSQHSDAQSEPGTAG